MGFTRGHASRMSLPKATTTEKTRGVFRDPWFSNPKDGKRAARLVLVPLSSGHNQWGRSTPITRSGGVRRIRLEAIRLSGR